MKIFYDIREARAEIERLGQELSLAEEGLANYAQENGVVRAEIDRLLDGLARIKEASPGDSIAWTLAYEALHNKPYSWPKPSEVYP